MGNTLTLSTKDTCVSTDEFLHSDQYNQRMYALFPEALMVRNP